MMYSWVYHDTTTAEANSILASCAFCSVRASHILRSKPGTSVMAQHDVCNLRHRW